MFWILYTSRKCVVVPCCSNCFNLALKLVEKIVFPNPFLQSVLLLAIILDPYKAQRSYVCSQGKSFMVALICQISEKWSVPITWSKTPPNSKYLFNPVHLREQTRLSASRDIMKNGILRVIWRIKFCFV